VKPLPKAASQILCEIPYGKVITYGGIQTKIKLLELEGVDMRGLFIPKKGTAL